MWNIFPAVGRGLIALDDISETKRGAIVPLLVPAKRDANRGACEGAAHISEGPNLRKKCGYLNTLSQS